MLLFAFAVQGGAQTFNGGVTIVGLWGISPRWSVGAETSVRWEHNSNITAIVPRISAGALFKVVDNCRLFAAVQESQERYKGLSNFDNELRFFEGARFDGSRGLSQYLFFSQRRISYYPLSQSSFCSDVTYRAEYEKELQEGLWELSLFAGVTLNIHENVAGSNLLQRFAPGCEVARRMGRMMIGIVYECRLGSKRQIFLADRHELHTIMLRLRRRH